MAKRKRISVSKVIDTLSYADAIISNDNNVFAIPSADSFVADMGPNGERIYPQYKLRRIDYGGYGKNALREELNFKFYCKIPKKGPRREGFLDMECR